MGKKGSNSEAPCARKQKELDRVKGLVGSHSDLSSINRPPRRPIRLGKKGEGGGANRKKHRRTPP